MKKFHLNSGCPQSNQKFLSKTSSTKEAIKKKQKQEKKRHFKSIKRQKGDMSVSVKSFLNRLINQHWMTALQLAVFEKTFLRKCTGNTNPTTNNKCRDFA